ncbi:ABC transporter ATP-binding protein [Afifella pfennigii]|uniref:ABC transporter ATP-binding protein n=1 Tax=Afifella pfennigii TaxID=209897 RepID=UPI00068E6B09|nr:ABC transporter ATP-binding protein [Afifella pfennigii]
MPSTKTAALRSPLTGLARPDTQARQAPGAGAPALNEPRSSAPEAAARPILRMHNVSKSFQALPVLKDLNLQIAEGEFLTLLGPSGCGKSTSLNIVAGLLAPDTGTVCLRGIIANDLPPQRRRLGMVFQSWALFPHMSVADNIAYGLRMAGTGDKTTLRRRVGEMLDLVRLPGTETKFPSQLSGGMQQRVALARALVTEPDLLLLDEPLSNLDAALRKEMQVELKRIHERLGVTTLLVTHSQEEALVMSDRIAVMRGGRIERIDTPMNVYADPRTSFVCTFVGDANVLTARVEALSAGEAKLAIGPLSLVAPAAPWWREGGEAVIALRPESLAIAAAGSQPGGADAAEAGRWSAKVTDRIFKGSSITYELSAGDAQIHLLALPQPDGRVFRRGEAAEIVVPKASVIALNAPEETEAGT